MAHVRKDSLVSPPDWWKHLRWFNKRRVSKAERQAARNLLDDEKDIMGNREEKKRDS